MTKSEGGIIVPKKYKPKYEFQLTENIDADIFDRDQKELYFGITFNLSNNPRGIVASWKLWESKIIASVLKKGFKEKQEIKKRLFKKGLKKARDEINEYYEHIEIKEGNRIFQMLLMLSKPERTQLLSYHEIGVSPLKINIQLPDYQAKKLLEERTKMIKHAKIDKIRDEEMIDFEGRIDLEQVELLLSLSEIKNLVVLLEKIERNEIPESEEGIVEMKEKEWTLVYSQACLCSECNKHTVEDEYLIGISNDAIDISYNKKEINELLWALKRLLQKYESEIKTLLITNGE